MEPIIIVLIIFGTIFGIIYISLTTRNKERMALIEKGANANLFARKRKNMGDVYKMVMLKFGMLFAGIGAGILTGSLLETTGLQDEVAYPSSIFIFGGTALILFYFLTKDKKIASDDQSSDD